jgi:hypothetical protein
MIDQYAVRIRTTKQVSTWIYLKVDGPLTPIWGAGTDQVPSEENWIIGLKLGSSTIMFEDDVEVYKYEGGKLGEQIY